jgi:threonine dehydratase
LIFDDRLAPVRLALKLELLQVTGSFKARGALNSCLSMGADAIDGVVTASGGNHGQAVAWAAHEVGIPATVFVPDDTPETKLAGIRRYNADLRIGGRAYAGAAELALGFAASMDLPFVHPYDRPSVVAGQGTLGLEVMEQLAEVGAGVDTVLVAVGGGGLAAGIALAVEGSARVVCVEPELCPTWHKALDAGAPVDVPNGGRASDALGATRLGEHAWSILTRTDAASVVVAEPDIAAARRTMWENYRLVLEPGGAVALSAVLSGAYVPEADERVLVVVCGSNGDPTDLSEQRTPAG